MRLSQAALKGVRATLGLLAIGADPAIAYRTDPRLRERSPPSRRDPGTAEAQGVLELGAVQD